MARPLLTELLKAVSRSFYLTLKVLPSSVRDQIGLAYLLARTSDTIADTEIIPAADRIEVLNQYQDRVLGRKNGLVDLSAFAGSQGDDSERELLERAEEGVSFLGGFSGKDQEYIRNVFGIITEGQRLDLERFDGSSEENLVSLVTEEELDDYTYRVAGCVGEFWSRICIEHAFPKAKLDEGRFYEDAVLFGKGLQLINILRDLPKDLSMGRCYMPEGVLDRHGLKPLDLQDASNEARFRPYYDSLIERAETYLRHGWRYTLSIPWTQARIRIACALPILIGAATLSLLRQSRVLGQPPVKISRPMVKGCLLKAILLYPLPSVWRSLHPLP